MPKNKRSGISPRLPNNLLPISKRYHDPDAFGPTQETVMRMAERLGREVYCDVKTRKIVMDGNPQAAANALSILHDKGRLSGLQFRAGNLYGSYHRVVFGRVTPKASGFSRWITDDFGWVSAGGLRTDADQAEWEHKCREAYDVGDAALQDPARSRYLRSMVRLICLDGLMPESDKEIKGLSQGLSVLTKAWRLRD